MKRSTFIKRLVMGAVAVPAVVAASKATTNKPTDAEIDAVVSSMFGGKVNNREDCLDGFQFLKPEDTPLYKPHTAT